MGIFGIDDTSTALPFKADCVGKSGGDARVLPSVQGEISADSLDRRLFEAVNEMKNPAAPMKIRRQYTDTLKMLNKMRAVHSRRRINSRSLKSRYIAPGMF